MFVYLGLKFTVLTYLIYLLPLSVLSLLVIHTGCLYKHCADVYSSSRVVPIKVKPVFIHRSCHGGHRREATTVSISPEHFQSRLLFTRILTEVSEDDR